MSSSPYRRPWPLPPRTGRAIKESNRRFYAALAAENFDDEARDAQRLLREAQDDLDRWYLIWLIVLGVVLVACAVVALL